MNSFWGSVAAISALASAVAAAFSAFVLFQEHYPRVAFPIKIDEPQVWPPTLKRDEKWSAVKITNNGNNTATCRLEIVSLKDIRNEEAELVKAPVELQVIGHDKASDWRLSPGQDIFYGVAFANTYYDGLQLPQQSGETYLKYMHLPAGLYHFTLHAIGDSCEASDKQFNVWYEKPKEIGLDIVP